MPQKCTLRRVSPPVCVLTSDKLFPVIHRSMEDGMMTRVWIENAD